MAEVHTGETHLPGTRVPGPAQLPVHLTSFLPHCPWTSSLSHPAPAPRDQGHRGADSEPQEPNVAPAGGGHLESGEPWAGGGVTHHSAGPAPPGAWHSVALRSCTGQGGHAGQPGPAPAAGEGLGRESLVRLPPPPPAGRCQGRGWGCSCGCPARGARVPMLTASARTSVCGLCDCTRVSAGACELRCV